MSYNEIKKQAREAEARWNELGQPGFLVEFTEKRYSREVVDFILDEAWAK